MAERSLDQENTATTTTTNQFNTTQKEVSHAR